MKTIIIFYLVLPTALCLLPTDSRTQTWNEWFRQKKTQKKYLVEQIAALKVYAGNLKKGIEVAHKGLNTIQNIKDGNFNLHRDFFSSLKDVNPHISNSAKIADIIAFQVSINRELKRLALYCKQNEQFTAEEVRYVILVYTNMLFLCDANLSELLILIRPDTAELTDDQRMTRIDLLYLDMQDKRAFAQTFSDDTKALALERAREQHALKLSSNLAR